MGSPIDFNLLTVQEDVFAELPSELKSKFKAFDLGKEKIQVRDDPNAKFVYYRCIAEEKKQLA
ncbi:MAG: hypothetical protein H7249_15650 [Chitinophagaceae bacterium]|nr:hypothetical protein [Oligoflexus sp.]